MNNVFNKQGIVLILCIALRMQPVPPVNDIEWLIGARFKVGDQLIDGNPYLTPLAGAVAWHSGLISALLRYGPVVLEVPEGETDPKNMHAVTRLVQYLFNDLGASVSVSTTDHAIVSELINKSFRWPAVLIALSNVPLAWGGLARLVKQHATFKTRVAAAASYAQRSDADLPPETVWLVLAAAWYAAVDRIQDRADLGWVDDAVVMRREFDFVRPLLQEFVQSSLRRGELQKQIIEAMHTCVADEATLALLLYSQLSIGYPAYVRMAHVEYNDEPVADCVENTLHNVVNLLVYDPIADRYDPAKYLPADSEWYNDLIVYYKKYAHPLDGISQEACQDWFVMLQGLTFFDYVRGNAELSAQFENIERALQRLVPAGHTVSEALTGSEQTVNFDVGQRSLSIEKLNAGSVVSVLHANILVQADRHAEAQFRPTLFSLAQLERAWNDARFDLLARLLRASDDEAYLEKPIARFIGVDSCAWRYLLCYTAPTAGAWLCDCVRVLATCPDWVGRQSLISATASSKVPFKNTDNKSFESLLRAFWQGDRALRDAVIVLINVHKVAFIKNAIKFSKKIEDLEKIYLLTDEADLLGHWLAHMGDAATNRRRHDFLFPLLQKIVERLHTLSAQEQAQILRPDSTGFVKMAYKMHEDDRLKLLALSAQDGKNLLAVCVSSGECVDDLLTGISARQLRDAIPTHFDEVILAAMKGLPDDEALLMARRVLDGVSVDELLSVFSKAPAPVHQPTSADEPPAKSRALASNAHFIDFVTALCSVEFKQATIDYVMQVLLETLPPEFWKSLSLEEKEKMHMICGMNWSTHIAKLLEVLR